MAAGMVGYKSSCCVARSKEWLKSAGIRGVERARSLDPHASNIMSAVLQSCKPLLLVLYRAPRVVAYYYHPVEHRRQPEDFQEEL